PSRNLHLLIDRWPRKLDAIQGFTINLRHSHAICLQHSERRKWFGEKEPEEELVTHSRVSTHWIHISAAQTQIRSDTDLSECRADFAVNNVALLAKILSAFSVLLLSRLCLKQPSRARLNMVWRKQYHFPIG